jgi:hypothetical protein
MFGFFIGKPLFICYDNGVPIKVLDIDSHSSFRNLNQGNLIKETDKIHSFKRSFVIFLYHAFERSITRHDAYDFGKGT